MPRYFFNIRDQHHLEQDDEGLELPNLDAAVEEAKRALREMGQPGASIEIRCWLFGDAITVVQIDRE
jgi:hypothetical protein